MPELPEVETVRRGLAPALVGATIERVELRRPDLRFPFPERFAARLQDRRVLDLRRRAKYLLADLDDGHSLIMHLGMSGSFRIDEETPGAFHHKRDKNAAHDHVVLHLDHARRVVYNDPRRFGYMLLIATHAIDEDKLFRGLGVEPLNGALDAAFLARAFRGRAAPAKALLLDQRLIAGLGNIYVCEALHRAHISPLRAAGSLVHGQRPADGGAGAAAAGDQGCLDGCAEGGRLVLRDHRQIDGSLGYFQHSFRVYDREGAACPTPGCKGTITRVVQSGRSTFYCPGCQK